MINLAEHEKDFRVRAKCHFHATAHRKGASDGIESIFKRDAAQNILLSKPSEVILSHEQLMKWGQSHFTNIKIFHYSHKTHEGVRRCLNRRFNEAQAVPQILSNHCFIVEKNKQMMVK